MIEHVFKRSVLILMVPVVTACTTVYSGTPGVSGPGEFNQFTGRYTQEFSAPFDQTWEATTRALEALELHIIKRAKDQIGGHILARRADGTDVNVELTPRGLAGTDVSIQVGWRDRDASIRVAKEVERKLPK